MEYKEFQIVARESGVVLDDGYYDIALESIRVDGGREVVVYANDMVVKSFFGPAYDVRGDLQYTLVHGPVRIRVEGGTFDEAIFRVISMVPSSLPVSSEEIALVELDTRGNTFPLGDRFYVILDVASSDFMVRNVHHESAIYSFVGTGRQGVKYKESEPIYFPFTTGLNSISIVDDNGNRVKLDDRCVVRMVKNRPTQTIYTTISNTDGRFRHDSTTDSTYVVTEQFETKDIRTVGKCEMALVSIKTTCMFDDNKRVVVKNGPYTLFTTFADDKGSVDLRHCNPVYCPIDDFDGTLSLSFEYPDGRQIVDGMFQAQVHIRSRSG